MLLHIFNGYLFIKINMFHLIFEQLIYFRMLIVTSRYKVGILHSYPKLYLVGKIMKIIILKYNFKMYAVQITVDL